MADFSQMQVLEGLQFIPVTKEKRPIPKDWQTDPRKHDLTNCPAIGLVCGKLSGGIECIDFDLKYDLTGTLMQRFKEAVREVDETLMNKMTVQRTTSGGFHWFYRCAKVQGNQKLANRPSTPAERQDTYERRLKKELSKGCPEDAAKKYAEEEARNDKVRVLIETRGEGGQFVIWPSKGYDLIFGDLQSISTITEEERDALMTIAASFNEVVEEYKPRTHTPPVRTNNDRGKSPFDDYNERGDIVQLLISHGWKFIRQRGDKIHLQRPGDTKAATSGNYDLNRRQFSVFSTSTVFESQKAYLPYAVYTIMEHNGDYQAARKALYDAGYGDREQDKRELNSQTPTRVSKIVVVSEDDLPFIAKPEDYDPYLKHWVDGTFPMGKTTGFNTLDKYFLLKELNLVMTNGHDNVGKTVMIWYLMLLASLLHKWRWVVFSAENSLGSCVKRMMEFFWGIPIAKMNPVQYKQAKQFVEHHFKIIKHEEELYNYKDLLNMYGRTMAKFSANRPSDYWSMLVDPYNALKIDLPLGSRLSTHEWMYQALTEKKMFLKKNGCGMYINNHVVTEALRKTDEDGYAIAPQKADTEGGGKFANKADEFITIHRRPQHPTNWMFTELHVRKMKEVETGGKQTPLDRPVLLKMMPEYCMFVEIENGNEWSPVRRFHGTKDANAVQPLPF